MNLMGCEMLGRRTQEMKKAIIRDPAWDWYYYPPQVVANTVYVYIYIYVNQMISYDMI